MLLNILLSATYDGKDAINIIFVFLAFGLGICLLGYIVSTVGDVRQSVKDGGLKGYYPNLIKFIMKNYSFARVVTDTSLHMTIISDDILKDVRMTFSFTLNPENKSVKIKGKIIPGNEKWAWMPPKEFEWVLKTSQGYQVGEQKVIEEIKEDMVFNPDY